MSVPVGDTALDAEVAMGLFKQLNDISLEDSLLALFMQVRNYLLPFLLLQTSDCYVASVHG